LIHQPDDPGFSRATASRQQEKAENQDSGRHGLDK